MALNLSVGEPQHDNFPRMESLFPTRSMAASKKPFQFPDGRSVDLPDTFNFEDREHSSEKFLVDTDTSALLKSRLMKG